MLVAIRCGCFYCPKTFQRSESMGWVPERDGEKTALCPSCGIDAVLPDDLPGVELSRELMMAMNRHWFALEEEL